SKAASERVATRTRTVTSATAPRSKRRTSSWRVVAANAATTQALTAPSPLEGAEATPTTTTVVPATIRRSPFDVPHGHGHRPRLRRHGPDHRRAHANRLARGPHHDLAHQRKPEPF